MSLFVVAAARVRVTTSSNQSVRQVFPESQPPRTARGRQVAFREQPIVEVGFLAAPHLLEQQAFVPEVDLQGMSGSRRRV